MNEIIFNIIRKLALYLLDIILGHYIKLNDGNKDKKLSKEEIKKSITQLTNFKKKFRK